MTAQARRILGVKKSVASSLIAIRSVKVARREMSTRAIAVDTVIRKHAGRVAVHVAPPHGVDLEFIYRVALSIYWNPADALLEDRSSAVESSEASAARIARALREDYEMVLQPSDNLQWKDFSAEEQSQIASALFG